eukprot:ctg_858.g375
MRWVHAGVREKVTNRGGREAGEPHVQLRALSDRPQRPTESSGAGLAGGAETRSDTLRHSARGRDVEKDDNLVGMNPAAGDSVYGATRGGRFRGIWLGGVVSAQAALRRARPRRWPCRWRSARAAADGAVKRTAAVASGARPSSAGCWVIRGGSARAPCGRHSRSISAAVQPAGKWRRRIAVDAVAGCGDGAAPSARAGLLVVNASTWLVAIECAPVGDAAAAAVSGSPCGSSIGGTSGASVRNGRPRNRRPWVIRAAYIASR